jgi:hypothetical protein
LSRLLRKYVTKKDYEQVLTVIGRKAYEQVVTREEAKLMSRFIAEVEKR